MTKTKDIRNDFDNWLEKQIQKKINSQIRNKHKKWWMMGKKVYCTECEHEDDSISDVMFGVNVTISLCKILKGTTQTNRYYKNKKHNCKDFELKEEK